MTWLDVRRLLAVGLKEKCPFKTGMSEFVLTSSLLMCQCFQLYFFCMCSEPSSTFKGGQAVPFMWGQMIIVNWMFQDILWYLHFRWKIISCQPKVYFHLVHLSYCPSSTAHQKRWVPNGSQLGYLGSSWAPNGADMDMFTGCCLQYISFIMFSSVMALFSILIEHTTKSRASLGK